MLQDLSSTKSIINVWQAVPLDIGLQYLSHQPWSCHDKKLTFIIKNNIYVPDLNMLLLGPEWTVKIQCAPDETNGMFIALYIIIR